MTTAKTRSVSKDEVARVLGIGRRQLDAYIKAGIPHDSEPYRVGTVHRFNTGEAHSWIVAHEVEKAMGTAGNVLKFADQRERLAAAQAEKAELQVEVMRGTLVPTDAVERAWSQTWSVIRDLMRAIPRGCVDRVLAKSAEGRPAVAQILQEEIDEALSRASAIEVVIETDDDGGEEAAA